MNMIHVVNIGSAAMYLGDCREVMSRIDNVDAIVTDPPYPEIDRDYGRLGEEEWHLLMDHVVGDARRLVQPRGSAVFILQPNSERVGRMRPWLFEFMARWARDWNMPQDVWWWNFAAPPTVHAHERNGLLKPSVKACVWLGQPSCYRDQNAVLWAASDAMRAANQSDRALSRFPSGLTKRHGRIAAKVVERNGASPFNLLPIANSNSVDSGGSAGHGAATPFDLCRWWVAYICPPGGLVLDPFAGSGTVGLACAALGRRYIGIELHEPHFRRACERLNAANRQQDFFNLPAAE